MPGKIYGIGVGPGDPELMTVKAVRLLREADVVAIPGKDRDSCVAYRIAAQAVAELEEKELLSVCFPMTKDPRVLERAMRGLSLRWPRFSTRGRRWRF